MSSKDPDDPRSRFLDLVHGHQPMLRKVCAVYAAGFEDREDLFQEIVLQLWRSWPSFRGDSSFATWGTRVALNTALFRRRKAVNEGRVGARDGPDPASIPAPNDPDAAEAEESIELLHGCMRTLRELDRAIVLLHLEGRPHAEIAEFAGLSTGNVTVRLHRIKNTLRECLVARGYGKE